MGEENQAFEEELLGRFERARPRLLGALYDGVAGAIAGYEAITIEEIRGYGYIRMVDAARWAEAGCRALGFEKGEYLRAYVRNQGQIMEHLFERNVVAKAVALLMEKYPEGWYGNMEPLYNETVGLLNRSLETQRWLKEKGWPNSSSWFSQRLRMAAPVLKAKGLVFNFDIDTRTGGGEKRELEIQWAKPIEGTEGAKDGVGVVDLLDEVISP
jgi:hypothetical protein